MSGESKRTSNCASLCYEKDDGNQDEQKRQWESTFLLRNALFLTNGTQYTYHGTIIYPNSLFLFKSSLCKSLLCITNGPETAYIWNKSSFRCVTRWYLMWDYHNKNFQIRCDYCDSQGAAKAGVLDVCWTDLNNKTISGSYH